jgi:plastocyanin
MPKVARKLLIAAILVLAGALAVASVTSASTSLSLRASKTKLAFNHKTLTAKHGTVTLVMSNPSGFPHAIAVEGHGVDKDGKTVNKGGTSRVTVKLKKGTYTFYCPVDGHKAAGMKGKLIVS